MRKQQDNRIFKTALYLRLSKDDEGKEESASIKNQRSIVTEYARRNGFLIVDEYVDDGYSGTNFDRPDYHRMIADIESGRINCVITKDLSRLGRNMSRISDLLDDFFPRHGVRYIAVIDGQDTFNPTNATSMTTPFLAVMHEMYARDTSNKIRSSFHAKMEKGEYIASFAPYGYKKDIENGNKNHLVIDYQVAHIVQEIFQMAADGFSPGEIAKHLNDKGIATPAMYRCMTRPYLNLDNYSKRKEWTSSMVCKMLSEEVYLGKTVQGKTSKISFKSKDTIEKPQDEWIVVEGTHEPLISEDVFRLVRNRSISRRSPPTKGFENVFSGIAKCADCGRNMTPAPSRKKGATYNLCCGGYKSYGADECGNHFIDYDLLYSSILQELRGWLTLSEQDKSVILDELEQAELQTAQRKKTGINQTPANMEKRLHEVTLLSKKLYEDYTFNRITATMYEKLSADYSTELSSLESSISDIKAQFNEQPSKSEAYNDFFSLLDEITDIKELTKPLLKKLIDRIEVEQGYYTKDDNGKQHKVQKIRVYYRFIGCVNEEEENT